MKAFALMDETSGAAFVDLPDPEPGPGEMRVRVRASSVNGLDVLVASGMAKGMEHRYPVVPGKDFAGVVDSVGDGTARFAVGDEVVGIGPPGMTLDDRGAYAEFVVVPAEGFVERKPGALTFEQAASVGLAAVTAAVAVEAVGGRRGELVMVAGATGGVGAYAVQLAAERGAAVLATAMRGDETWIRDLGAAQIVDYTGDVARAVRTLHPEGIDALIDAVNRGDAHAPLAELVKDGGRIASTTGAADLDALAKRGISGSNVFGQAAVDPYERVLAMAGDGTLVVPITRTFAFDQLPEALGLVGSRSSRGKFAIAIP